MIMEAIMSDTSFIFHMDDLHLRKFDAKEKMCKVLDFVDQHYKGKMIRTASNIDPNALINLFAQMLGAFLHY